MLGTLIQNKLNVETNIISVGFILEFAFDKFGSKLKTARGASMLNSKAMAIADSYSFIFNATLSLGGVLN